LVLLEWTAICAASLVFLFDLLVLLVTSWNVQAWPRVRKVPLGKSEADSVSVLIPARDEEHRIGACLKSLAGQHPCVVEILVYDDHSTDRTADVVAQWAEKDPRIRTISPAPLPNGWCGKPFACAQLAKAASSVWLLFLDADTQVQPETVASLVQEARLREATLLSCWPDLLLETFWERLLMPMFGFCLFNLFPAPLSLERRDPSLGMAHGACILARRDTYDRLGGHEMVKDKILEDAMLARRWREHGEYSILLDGTALVHLRMYTSFAQIWRGFQKNFYPAFRHAAGFWAYLALHFFAFLVPFAGLSSLWCRAGALWLLAAGALCVFGSRLLLARRFRQPIWSALLHPLAEFLLIALALSSWRRATTVGVEWKGRTYRNC